MVKAFVERDPVHQTRVPGRGYHGHIRFRGAQYETVFGNDPFYFEHVAALLQDPKGRDVGLQINVEPGEEGVFEQALSLVRPELMTATVMLPRYAEAEEPPSILPPEDHDHRPVYPIVEPEPLESAVILAAPPPVLDDPQRPMAPRKERKQK